MQYQCASLSQRMPQIQIVHKWVLDICSRNVQRYATYYTTLHLIGRDFAYGCRDRHSIRVIMKVLVKSNITQFQANMCLNTRGVFDVCVCVFELYIFFNVVYCIYGMDTYHQNITHPPLNDWRVFERVCVPHDQTHSNPAIFPSSTNVPVCVRVCECAHVCMAMCPCAHVCRLR